VTDVCGLRLVVEYVLVLFAGAENVGYATAVVWAEVFDDDEVVYAVAFEEAWAELELV
jgi:hypothetical protein